VSIRAADFEEASIALNKAKDLEKDGSRAGLIVRQLRQLERRKRRYEEEERKMFTGMFASSPHATELPDANTPVVDFPAKSDIAAGDRGVQGGFRLLSKANLAVASIVVACAVVVSFISYNSR